MTNCRQGLECLSGACRDIDNLPTLQEGELCSDSQGNVPTGFLGTCNVGLVCDSNDTQTCIEAEPITLVPVGGECTAFGTCEMGSYCRPIDGVEASETSPGVCTSPTPAGQACSLAYECERICVDGFCEAPPPLLCEVLGGWTGSRDVIGPESSSTGP